MSMVFVLTLPGVLGFIVAFQPGTGRTGAWTATSDGGASSADERPGIGPQVYARACLVCHGANGEGVPRLGKPLRNSAFVREHGEEELFRVIAEGRLPGDPLNTTGALMPARGAQGLSEGQIREVIAYLRTMQDPSAPVASLDAWMPAGDGGAGGSAGVDLASLKGYGSYAASCSACHGANAEGMEGLGLPLSTSGFVLGASDKDLVNFIKTGRPVWDEANSTGLDMPPKGGNPAITDGDLEEIVAFLRAAQKASVGG
jgi:disulfide bond formation protein DsbB